MQITNTYEWGCLRNWTKLDVAAFVSNGVKAGMRNIKCELCDNKLTNYIHTSGCYSCLCGNCMTISLSFINELRDNGILISEFDIDSDANVTVSYKVTISQYRYICGISDYCAVKAALGDLCSDVMTLILCNMFNAGLARITTAIE